MHTISIDKHWQRVYDYVLPVDILPLIKYIKRKYLPQIKIPRMKNPNYSIDRDDLLYMLERISDETDNCNNIWIWSRYKQSWTFCYKEFRLEYNVKYKHISIVFSFLWLFDIKIGDDGPAFSDCIGRGICGKKILLGRRVAANQKSGKRI
jgi:hypothetical protein